MERKKIAISLLTLFFNYAFCLKAQPSNHSDGAPLPGTIVQKVEPGSAPLPGLAEQPEISTINASIKHPVPLELVGHRLIVPIVLKTQLNSHTAYVGNPILAILKDDLIMAGRKIADKGSLVKGHVSSVATARTLSQALVSSERRYNSRGAVQIQFEEILDQTNGSIPISGLLSQQEVVFAAGTPQRREISVRENGLITRGEPSLSPEKKNFYNATRVLTVAPFPASILVNVAGPSLVMGAGAAIDPAFAYVKPVEPTESHKRLKAFAYAFITNLPGAFYVQSVVEKGNEIDLKDGDELALDICLKGDGRDTTQPYMVTNIKGVVLPATGKTDRAPSIDPTSLALDGLKTEAPREDNALSRPKTVLSNQKVILPLNGGIRLLPVVQSPSQPSL
jgi:hypothetical protein